MSELVTLKSNRDFRRLYRQSKSFVGPALVVYFKENSVGFSRLGITAGKKIGCAVKRNRSKRVIREAYRNICDELNKNIDIVVVARAKSAYMMSQDIEKSLRDLLGQAGLLD